jgi:hypothetical protein
VRVLNATRRDQNLTKLSLLAHCKAVTLVISTRCGTAPGPRLKPEIARRERSGQVILKQWRISGVGRILAEYEDIFAVDSEDYGRINRVYHRIDKGGTRPIHQSPRRLPIAKQAEVSEILEDMQRRWVIKESDSPWSSPVVLTRKKYGEIRFCVDYRKLIDVTKEHCFPLPWIDHTLDTLAGAK